MNCTFGQRYILSGKNRVHHAVGRAGPCAHVVDHGRKVRGLCDREHRKQGGRGRRGSDRVSLEKITSTKSILIYMEGLKDGRKFYDSSKVVAAKKPIVVIKSGRSKRGALAVTSHTGSIAGQDAIFSVAFNEAGILRADTMTQAFDWIQSINENPFRRGKISR